MTLDEVFTAGHSVALSRNPLRRAVRIEQPPDKAGIWVVSPGSVPALPAKKRVDAGDLVSKVEGQAREGEWGVDFAHCWCAACTESRRLSQTACD